MNKFHGMYRITAAIAESEPVHERLFNQPARPLRPELRAALARLDREAADRAVARRDMAAMKGSAGTVAHEADAPAMIRRLQQSKQVAPTGSAERHV